MKILCLLILILCGCYASVDDNRSRVNKLPLYQSRIFENEVRAALENLREILRNGYPELGIPSLNPLEIDNLLLDLNVLNLDFFKGTININNFVLSGLADWVLEDLKINPVLFPPGAKVDSAVSWPIVNLSTFYNLDITIFEFGIDHSGSIEGVFSKLLFKLFVQVVLGNPIAIKDFALTPSLEAASLKIDDVDLFDLITSVFTNILELIRMILIAGIPDLGIPSLNPLEVSKFTVDLALLNLEFLQGTFTIDNLVLTGITDWVQDSFTINPTLNPLGIDVNAAIRWPTLDLLSSYNINISVSQTTINHSGTIAALVKALNLEFSTQVAVGHTGIIAFDLTPSVESGNLLIDGINLKSIIEIISNVKNIIKTVSKLIKTISTIVTTFHDIGQLIATLEGTKSLTLNTPIGSIKGTAILNGLSKLGITSFQPEIVPSSINTIVRFGLAGDSEAHIIVNYNLQITDPDLSWMAGEGVIDMTIKDTDIVLEILLQDKLSLEDLLFNISKETKFTRFEHAGADLSDAINSSLHNLNIQDIISVLLLDYIKFILAQKSIANNMGSMISSNLEKLDKDVVKGFITFAQRARDL